MGLMDKLFCEKYAAGLRHSKWRCAEMLLEQPSKMPFPDT